MSRTALISARDTATPDFFSRLFRSIENILEGKTRNYGTFTLTASAASTAVSDPRFESHQSVVWAPTTANASAEIGAGTIYVSAKTKGQFTITHANNAQSDRTFDYVIVG